MKIFISHPYGRRKGISDTAIERNVKKTIELSRKIIARGHTPFIPNLYHYVDKGWKDSCGEDIWLQIALQWIECCDAFYYGGNSDGCNEELAEAQALGKIIYTDIDDVPEGDINNKTYFLIAEVMKVIRPELEKLVVDSVIVMADAMMSSINKEEDV